MSSSSWKATDVIERQLIQNILNGDYPKESPLPSERDLAYQFGVGRPAVREALQRLQRDGWIRIRTGHPAVVNDIWKFGNLATLSHLVHDMKTIIPSLIVHLLEVRVALTPAYVRDAVSSHPAEVVGLLQQGLQLPLDAHAFAVFDWDLQRTLAGYSHNPVYLLMLNSFEDCYIHLAEAYFIHLEHQQASQTYYATLQRAAEQNDANQAYEIVREAMQQSLELYRKGVEGHA